MRVLMIEDNENDFLLVNRLVAKNDDLEIQWCNTLKKGLLHLRDNPFNALLLDLMLPDGNGLEVLGQVQTQFPALPIIILSGNEADELAIEAVRRGAQDYLVKGKIDGLMLERSLRYAVERKRIDEILQAKIQEESLFQNYLIALHEITIELTAIDDVDEFYKRAVELGLQRLGFDRLGFLLYDPTDSSAVGTYGTDAHGKVVAEHHLRLSPSALTNILKRTMEKEERFAVDEVTQLFSNFEPIGEGWNAAAILWNGTEKLGWLAIDNGVQHQPLSHTVLNVLALYAVTLGTLLGEKRSQIAVRESEQRLRLLAQNSPDFIYILSLNETERVYLNRETFLRYSQSEMIGSGALRHAVHPSDNQRVMAHWQALTSQGKHQQEALIEYRLQDKAGQWHWVQSRETIFASDVDDNPTQILVTLTDITERKEAEENLTRERDLLRTLIDSSPDYISLKDLQGRFILVNKSLAEASGMTVDEQVGKTAFDILPQDLALANHEADMRIMQSGEPEINVERNTTEKVLLSTKIPLRDKDGNITSLIGIGRDITERKQFEAQALELAAERGRTKVLHRFINDMSHDFRTPLSTINTSLYLMKKTTDPEKQAVYIKRAEQHVHRMDKLLEELLQMERLDKRDTIYEYGWADLNVYLAPLVHEYELLSAQKQITLEFAPDADPCVALIDMVEFARLVTMLLDNAIIYTPDGGHITVRTKKMQDEVFISVKDTGIGISDIDLPHIFERFYRADSARSTETGGVGLGLSIAHRIIEAHKGSIDVESEVGKGSTFTVKLNAVK